MDESARKSTRTAREDLRSVDAEGRIPDYEAMGFIERAKQMQLASWQPEFATPWVVSALVLTTAVFIPLGALIIIASDRSQEVRLRYDDRSSLPTWPDKPNGATCDWNRRLQLARDQNPNVPDDQLNASLIPDHCRVSFTFTIEETMDPPVFMYYEITGMYQNFRKLVNSRSDKQLSAQTTDCKCRDAPACLPQERPGQEKQNDNWMINYTDNRPERCPNNGDPCPAGEQQQKKLSDFYYGPCGQMPYVMFNDSFLLKRKGQNGNADRVVCNSKLFSERGDRNVSRTDLRPTHIPGTGVPTDYHENPCNKTGIAWSGDTESSGRFQEFPKETTALTAEGLCGGNCMVTSVVDDNGNVPPEANDIVTGINRGYYWREYGHKIPVQTDLDFIVWSRPATLPKFKKLHRIIQKPLVPGDEYILDIEDRFPVGPFSGEKAVVFATRTWIGSDNTVLGGAYCFIGSLACVWALLFVVLHLKNPLGGYTPENMKQLEADAFSGGSQAERKGK